MSSDNLLLEARHIIGLDLGTTNVRIHVAHYPEPGQVSGAPSLVHIPGSERDGALPSVLEIDDSGSVRSYGRPALMKMLRSHSARFVSEYKPCIGQSPDDLHAQGRPEKARFCGNPACPHPGWAWSIAMSYCGFCGGEMQPATAAGARWQPVFPYSQAEALGYAQQLISQLASRLEAQFGESLQAGDGWAVAAGVPVHWQPSTLSAYESMLRQAFPDTTVQLVNEPTGALCYYALQDTLAAMTTAEKHVPGWTLVVDFGGGTTDLVLAKIDMPYGRLRVGEIRSYGERYGGIDFDLMLAHHAASELGVTLDGGLLTQWKFQAKELKEAFSAQVQQERQEGGSTATDSTVTVGFPVPRDGGAFVYVPLAMGRSTFNRVAGDLIERFRSVLERGLQHLQVSGHEVQQVVLTGGGAHWFFVQDTVKELLPHAHMLSGLEPEMSVSRGLALSGARARTAVTITRIGAPASEAPRRPADTAAQPAPAARQAAPPKAGAAAQPDTAAQTIATRAIAAAQAINAAKPGATAQAISAAKSGAAAQAIVAARPVGLAEPAAAAKPIVAAPTIAIAKPVVAAPTIAISNPIVATSAQPATPPPEPSTPAQASAPVKADAPAPPAAGPAAPSRPAAPAEPARFPPGASAPAAAVPSKPRKSAPVNVAVAAALFVIAAGLTAGLYAIHPFPASGPPQQAGRSGAPTAAQVSAGAVSIGSVSQSVLKSHLNKLVTAAGSISPSDGNGSGYRFAMGDGSAADVLGEYPSGGETNWIVTARPVLSGGAYVLSEVDKVQAGGVEQVDRGLLLAAGLGILAGTVILVVFLRRRKHPPGAAKGGRDHAEPQRTAPAGAEQPRSVSPGNSRPANAPPQTIVSVASLVVTEGPHRGEKHLIQTGDNHIGRSADLGCAIILNQDGEVSGCHGVVQVTRNGQARYNDTSRGGSTVDGVFVHHGQHPLRSGSVIKIGASKLIFESRDISSAAAGQARQPEPAGQDNSPRPVDPPTPMAASGARSAATLVSEIAPDTEPRSAPSAYLQMGDAEDSGHIFALKQLVTTIGRENCDIAIPFYQISRRHATITADHGRYIVTDEGSTHGTFVNGVRVGPAGHPLSPEDRLTFGPSSVKLRYCEG